MSRRDSLVSSRLLQLTSCLLYAILFYSGVYGDVGDVGMDRYGSDFVGMPIVLGSNATVADCEALCIKTEGCRAWAMAPTGLGSCPDLSNPCWLKNPVPPLQANPCRVSGVVGETLIPLVFKPFMVGQILPQGWLNDQLQLQADGLAGYLADFWPNIANSTWIGGDSEDPGGLEERVPYWLNGVVPMAFLLQNERVSHQVFRYVDYILDHQNQTSGWFGSDCCDPWPRYPLLLALIQYAEGNSSDPRPFPAIMKFLQGLRTLITNEPLSSWAQYRWQDLVLAIHYMYDNQPMGQEQFLLDLAEEVQLQGFDWQGYFSSNEEFPTTACYGGCQSLATHGVNNGQGMKTPAVWYRQSGISAGVNIGIEQLDRYHGQASGIFSCSEHLAGLVPSQGSELCTVVETMFSFEVFFSVFGNVSYADRVEQLAYNALPAAIDPYMWAHVYLQQSNQINAKSIPDPIYVSDGPDSNIYGLAPNYGCCTVNFPQGWSKFITQLYMESTKDNGIVAMSYAPSSLNTQLANGNNVSIVLETDYPFGEELDFVITATQSFPFYVRIPSWAVNATVQANDQVSYPDPGTFFIVDVESGDSKVVVNLPMVFRTTTRYNNSVSIYRGPFLYALNMGENWTELAYYAYNSSDWEINPLSPWSIALAVDPSNPNDGSISFQQSESVSPIPFSLNGTPVKALVQAATLTSNEWPVVGGAAAPPPESPVTPSSSVLKSVELIPFGATDLRIAEFPYLSAESYRTRT